MTSSTSSIASVVTMISSMSNNHAPIYDFSNPSLSGDSGRHEIQRSRSRLCGTVMSTCTDQQDEKQPSTADTVTSQQAMRRSSISLHSHPEFQKYNTMTRRGDLLLDFMPTLFTLGPDASSQSSMKTSSHQTSRTTTKEENRRYRPKRSERLLSLAYDNIDRTYYLSAHLRTKRGSKNKPESRQSKLTEAWDEAQDRLNRRQVEVSSSRSPSYHSTKKKSMFIPPKWEGTHESLCVPDE
ncbi:hypothetical protein AAMO2058_001377200 [Amorphochlora amoebiformis]